MENRVSATGHIDKKISIYVKILFVIFRYKKVDDFHSAWHIMEAVIDFAIITDYFKIRFNIYSQPSVTVIYQLCFFRVFTITQSLQG
jgi:hypothetical protein